MNTSVEFPKVFQNDPSDVASAIETAQALWRKGDLQESLRWVRRAAEAAETEGDDIRALSLARAAADLQEQYRPSVVPPAPSPAAPPPARASAPPVSAAPVTAASATARASTPPARASVPPSRAAAALASAGLDIPPAPKLEPWSPPGTRTEEPARAPDAPSRRPPPLKDASSPRAAPPPEAAPAARAAPTPEVVTPVAPPSTQAEPRAAKAPSDARTAVRVSVEASPKGSGTLVVRLLGEGASPAAGAFEALLVPLSPGVDLREL